MLHITEEKAFFKIRINFRYLISSFNFLIYLNPVAPMPSINAPTITQPTTTKFPGPVIKYIIAANSIMIPAIISKYATNFATTTACSRSTIYKENWV